MRNLRWLPVKHQFNFKLAKLAFNCCNNNLQLYLMCLLNNLQLCTVTSHSIRSSWSN